MTKLTTTHVLTIVGLIVGTVGGIAAGTGGTIAYGYFQGSLEARVLAVEEDTKKLEAGLVPAVQRIEVILSGMKQEMALHRHKNHVHAAPVP